MPKKDAYHRTDEFNGKTPGQVKSRKLVLGAEMYGRGGDGKAYTFKGGGVVQLN